MATSMLEQRQPTSNLSLETLILCLVRSTCKLLCQKQKKKEKGKWREANWYADVCGLEIE